LFDWGGDKEKVEIESKMEEVKIVEVMKLDEFIRKKIRKKNEEFRKLNSSENKKNVYVKCK
jgi:hypothetical protein